MSDFYEKQWNDFLNEAEENSVNIPLYVNICKKCKNIYSVWVSPGVENKDAHEIVFTKDTANPGFTEILGTWEEGTQMIPHSCPFCEKKIDWETLQFKAIPIGKPKEAVEK